MSNMPRPRLNGSYVLLPDPSSHDGKGMLVWPNPYDPKELQYRLRYGPPLTCDELLVVASYLEAYQYLITALPQRIRNQRCSELKEAVELDTNVSRKPSIEAAKPSKGKDEA
jgi:hypothetical protein